MIGKKVLTICEYGNSRSVALAWILKDKYKRDALACGICACSPDTFKMLCEWADTIIVTYEPIMKDMDQWKDKTLLFDVGRDRYFLGYVPELIAQYEQYIRNIEL